MTKRKIVRDTRAEVPVHVGKIEMVDIDDIKFSPENPNTHSEAQIQRLMKLLKKGVRHAAVCNADTEFLVAGEGRITAAKRLEMKKYPVSYQHFADSDEEYQFMVSDNAIQFWSHIDKKRVNERLQHFDPSFDIDLLGIQNFKLDVSERIAETGSLALDIQQSAGRKQLVISFAPADFQVFLPKLKLSMDRAGHETIKDFFVDLVESYLETPQDDA